MGKAVFCFAASHMVPAVTSKNVLHEDTEMRIARTKVTAPIEYTDYSGRWRKIMENKIGNENARLEHIGKWEDFIGRVDAMLCRPPTARPLPRKENAVKKI